MCTYGRDLLSRMQALSVKPKLARYCKLPATNRLFQLAAAVALDHHERMVHDKYVLVGGYRLEYENNSCFGLLSAISLFKGASWFSKN
jgi:hypothetical protein